MLRDARVAPAGAVVLLLLLTAVLGPVPGGGHAAGPHTVGTRADRPAALVVPPGRAVAAPAPAPASTPTPGPSAKIPTITVTSFTNATTAGVKPLAVQFSISVTSGPGVTGPVSYTLNWTFGDGSPVLSVGVTNSTTNSNATDVQSHVYTALGEYNASVEVTNNLGSAPVFSHKNVVYVEVALKITWTTTDNPVDLGHGFNATASISGGVSPYTEIWLATPTGCIGNLNNLSCAPPASGPYYAHLQVSDVHGLRTNSWQNFTVKPALAVRLTYQSWFFCNGTTGTYQANLTAYSNTGTSPYVITWDFGDGTPNATSLTVIHRFAVGPVYVVRAIVVDSGGGTFNGSLNISTAYPSCTSNTSVNYVPPLILLQGGIFLLAIALVVLVLLLVRRRSAPAAPPPVASWQESPPGDTGGGGSEAAEPGPSEPTR